MKHFEWNKIKNEKLKIERDICFEDSESAFDDERVLDVIEHPNISRYPNQKQFIFVKDDYIYIVPFVEDENKVFLKTIYPSRKMTKKYLERNNKK